MRFKDGRELEAGVPVSVYWNLQKPGLYSVMQRGKVIGWSEHIVLSNARVKIIPKKLASMKAGNKREVCVMVHGNMVQPHTFFGNRLRCNPRISENFVDAHGNEFNRFDVISFGVTGNEGRPVPYVIGAGLKMEV